MVAPNPPTPAARFPLGQLVATPGALRLVEASGVNPAELLRRHQNGDYGVIDKTDWQANEQAIVDGERILSAYLLPTGEKLWVITEADRSSTCILTPDEY